MVERTKTRTEPAPELTAKERLITLLGLALILGLAESLSAFFLGRVRFESGPVWLEELALTVVLGTAAGGVLVLGLGALLKSVGRLVGGKAPQGGWRKVVGRIGGLPSIALVWLVIRLEASGGSWVFRVVFGMMLGAVLVLYLIRGLAPGLARARAAWPLIVGPLATFVSWWAMGNLARKRFESDEAWTTLVYAIAPLALCGVAWALTYKRPALVRYGVVLLALVLSAGMMFSSRPEVPRPPEGDKPNVIFIVVDTLRADRVWGEHESMPRVKQLAGTGIYYTHAYTPIPKTQQSVASFHTGLYPWNTEVRTLKQVLDPEHDTIAEKFARAGYHTAAFVHNPWIDYGMGHEQGFHEYHDYYKVESFSYLLHATLPISLLDHTVGRKRGAYKFQVDGARITDRIVAWLANPPAEPYFMWIHYFDPHWPYLPPGETPGVEARDFEVAGPINGMRGHSQRGVNIFHGQKGGITDEQRAAAASLYSGEARYSDQHIGRILDRLEGRPHPLVVITADHGESLGEHDYHFHHGAFTYDVCLRVPLLVAWPGHVPDGRVVEDPVMTVDILPTLTSLAGLGSPKVDGVVLPGVDGASSGDPDRVIPFEGDIKLFEANDRIHLKGVKGKWRGVIAERHKLIAVPHNKGTKHQFYDLAQDPGETRDVYDIQQEAAARFAAELDAAGLSPGGEFDEAGGGGGYRLDPEEVERLRSLGYLQ